jgi:hypothetical protein
MEQPRPSTFHFWLLTFHSSWGAHRSTGLRLGRADIAFCLQHEIPVYHSDISYWDFPEGDHRVRGFEHSSCLLIASKRKIGVRRT